MSEPLGRPPPSGRHGNGGGAPALRPHPYIINACRSTPLVLRATRCARIDRGRRPPASLTHHTHTNTHTHVRPTHHTTNNSPCPLEGLAGPSSHTTPWSCICYRNKNNQHLLNYNLLFHFFKTKENIFTIHKYLDIDSAEDIEYKSPLKESQLYE